MKLSDQKGKVFLLVFWGTWCGPCMADVPHQQALLKQYAGKPFAIVGVNSDNDRQATQKACAFNQITWRSFWDGGSTAGPISEKWNVQGWPTVYLIDRAGVIRYKTDYLRRSSVREDKNGNRVQFSYLDDAVAELVMEATARK